MELDGKMMGCHVTIRVDVVHLMDKLHSFVSSKYNGKNWLCGLATIMVTKAFDVPVPLTNAATYVKVQYGGGGHPPPNSDGSSPQAW